MLVDHTLFRRCSESACAPESAKKDGILKHVVIAPFGRTNYWEKSPERRGA